MSGNARVVSRILIFLIKGLRPFLGPAHCKYALTCTPFAILTLETVVWYKAIFIIIKRILLCNPFVHTGFTLITLIMITALLYPSYSYAGKSKKNRVDHLITRDLTTKKKIATELTSALMKNNAKTKNIAGCVKFLTTETSLHTLFSPYKRPNKKYKPIKNISTAERYILATHILKKNKDINATSEALASTVLHTTVIYGQSCDFNFLITHGVDINKQDANGNTALHKICSSGRLSFLKTFLPHLPDPWIKNDNNQIAYELVMKNDGTSTGSFRTMQSRRDMILYLDSYMFYTICLKEYYKKDVKPLLYFSAKA